MQFEQTANCITLSGILNMDTITQTLVSNFLDQLSHSEVDALDLSEVTQADSACVSLLLCAKRHLLKHNRSLVLHHLPESVTALLNLYELDQILKIT